MKNLIAGLLAAMLCVVSFFALALPGDNGNKVTGLKWAEPTTYVNGESVPAGAVIGYYVYQRTGSDCAADPSIDSYSNDNRANITQGASVNFSDMVTQDGVYCLSVTAYEDVGTQKVESALSDEIKVIARNGSYFTRNVLDRPGGLLYTR